MPRIHQQKGRNEGSYSLDEVAYILLNPINDYWTRKVACDPTYATSALLVYISDCFKVSAVLDHSSQLDPLLIHTSFSII